MSHSFPTYCGSSIRTLIQSTLQKWLHSDEIISRGRFDFVGAQDGIEFLWMDAMTMEHPFQTIFSVGLSNKSMEPIGSASAFNRIELIMHLPLSWPASGKRLQLSEYHWPEEWLRTLARSVLDGSIPLPGTHVIISNDEPPVPLGPGTEQTCLLLIADFYQCFPIETSEGQKIHFYHVVPLYTEERDFEKANGMQPLLEAMAAVGLESLVVRPDRKRFV
jgi:hypothetical protein